MTIRSMSAMLAARLAFPIAVVGTWDVAARLSWYNTALLPPPSQVAQAWWQLLDSGVLVPAIIGSVGRVLTGFTAAAVLAVALAILLARFGWLEKSVRPSIELLRPISPIAWIPLAILWFRSGDRPAYFIVFIGSFFPILLNVVLGVQSVPDRAMKVAQSFGAGWWLRLTDVVWPAAKPSIVTGLRLGLGVGWMSLIGAELISVRTGLGYLIQINRVALRMDNVVAVMLSIGVIGLGMNWLIQLYARRSMPWWREPVSL